MNKLIDLLKLCGEDVDVHIFNTNVEVTFNDFLGFTEDWEEITRNFLYPTAVNNVFQYLADNGVLTSDDLYKVYSLDDYTITVGYASYDI